MAGWLNGGMVEWQEWRPNGGIVGMAAKWRNGDQMAEWSNGGNGYLNGGMVEWRNG
jgi:hypothetical protein